MAEPKQFSAEEFFAQSPQPADLDKHLQQVHDFVQHNLNQGKRVVLITVRPCLHTRRSSVASWVVGRSSKPGRGVVGETTGSNDDGDVGSAMKAFPPPAMVELAGGCCKGV
jgi:hypothetical protein